MESVLSGTPTFDLIIRKDDLTATARDLVAILAGSGRVFDRGWPTKVVPSSDSILPRVVPLNEHGIVNEAHELARPVILTDGSRVPKTLPNRVAALYLARHDWGLPPLRGITTAPLLFSNGKVHAAEGYDPQSGMWCARVPDLDLPLAPSRNDAETALSEIRDTFRTFPFADAITSATASAGVSVVDLSAPPGQDESAFLAGLMTAICRPSLQLAPGFLIAAPSISGAGTGKGLLAAAISLIAFGIEPRALQPGRNESEMDKRLGAALMEATPLLFLDNVNSTSLRSDLLASILAEPVVDVRILGSSRIARLNSRTFVTVTGNGIALSEDLARRFLLCELNAHMEDPESRTFAPGFREGIALRRSNLLRAALTIWRWGRQSETTLPQGRPLGSYETWCRWVRDPLLALGCADPVARSVQMKSRDPLRQDVSQLFATWWECHQEQPVRIAELAPRLMATIDAQKRGRQFVAAAVGHLVGTRAAGFVLTRQDAPGRWGAATYALNRINAPDGQDFG